MPPTIYIEPPSHHFAGDRLFQEDAVPFAGDRIMAPYACVRDVLGARGVAVHTADLMPLAASGNRLLYVSIGNLANCRRLAERPDVTMSALFAMECPVMDPGLYRGLRDVQNVFRRIYSWSDSPSLERFTGGPLRLEPFCWPQSYDDVHEEIWRNEDRRFMVMMNGNKLPAVDSQSLHAERLRALHYFEQFGEIDLYGREWDQAPHRVGGPGTPYTVRRLERAIRTQWLRLRPDPLLESARRAWKGATRSKSRTLGAYAFAICFENMSIRGWVTEKIFDCFFSGTIPIYRGATDVERHIPPDCFIDMRRFDSYAELRVFLKSLSSSELGGYRERARAYLRSDAFYPFSKRAFADVFLRIVEQDAGGTNGRTRVADA